MTELFSQVKGALSEHNLCMASRMKIQLFGFSEQLLMQRRILK